jgi:hypothetical protein
VFETLHQVSVTIQMLSPSVECRWVSSGMLCRVVCRKFTDVPEVLNVAIIMVVSTRLNSVTSQKTRHLRTRHHDNLKHHPCFIVTEVSQRKYNFKNKLNFWSNEPEWFVASSPMWGLSSPRPDRPSCQPCLLPGLYWDLASRVNRPRREDKNSQSCSRKVRMCGAILPPRPRTST